ncbi:MAG: hypothetical protein WC001_02180, partial [Desulfurivibrionaceae bacterium]
VTLCAAGVPGYHFFISGCRAPHLAAIGPAHVPDVRIAVPLAAICGTLQPLAIEHFFLFIGSSISVIPGTPGLISED